ncbi:MAG TPA: hypothetical protein PKV75_06470 [Desulfobacterales bacterium]|nr:hypothetical protein [Desulfobacterales bacterium]
MSKKMWREEDIESIARKIAEKVVDEKIKALKKRVDKMESIYNGLTVEQIKERMAIT